MRGPVGSPILPMPTGAPKDGRRFHRPHGGAVSEIERRLIMQTIDWTEWRAASVSCGGLVAERWHRCGGGVYHVALFNSGRGASLVVTDVPEMGCSLWDPEAGRGYDSDCPAHWGSLDAILGSRGLWREELADAAKRFVRD